MTVLEHLFGLTWNSMEWREARILATGITDELEEQLALRPLRHSPCRYTYTNSGAEDKWEGLDVPVIRQVRVEAEDRGKRLYAPIDTFGKMYMHADPWYTNAAGNALIARAVLETLRQDARVKRYLARIEVQKGCRAQARYPRLPATPAHRPSRRLPCRQS